MRLISEAQILEVLRRQNDWWRSGKVSEDLAPSIRRLAFHEIQSLLIQPELKRAVILTGARRVGKTVLLHQTAQEAIGNGKPPKKIFYLTFEDLTLTQTDLREILDIYEKNIEKIDKETLILLDEIHYTKDWSRWLMTVIREFPNTRIVATGSAAVLLRDQETNESGVGRWTSVHIPTLSFYEYLLLRRINVPALPQDLTIDSMFQLSIKEQQDILSACLDLQREFNRYLLQGGFPATVKDDFSLILTQRLLREDVIDKALKRDMAHLYGVRNLSELDQIFVYLCFNTGGIVEKNTLAKELGSAAATVEKHLQRLEDAHLIYRLPPFNLGGKKALKPRYKAYIADPTLRNAVILRGEGIFNDERELGQIIEMCVFKHLYAFYYSEHPRIGYWRSARGEREIDFLIGLPNGRQIGCEVKYSEKPFLSPKDGLVQWLDEGREQKTALLITKKDRDYGLVENKRVFQIPAFLFTYLLGHMELQKWLKEFPQQAKYYGADTEPLSARNSIRNLPKTKGDKP